MGIPWVEVERPHCDNGEWDGELCQSCMGTGLIQTDEIEIPDD